MDVQVVGAEDFVYEEEAYEEEMVDEDTTSGDDAANSLSVDRLLARLVGAHDIGKRKEALIALTDCVVNTFGPSGERLADEIRASGAIPVLVACLRESDAPDLQQCAMECLGTLFTTSFDGGGAGGGRGGRGGVRLAGARR